MPPSVKFQIFAGFFTILIAILGNLPFNFSELTPIFNLEPQTVVDNGHLGTSW